MTHDHAHDHDVEIVRGFLGGAGVAPSPAELATLARLLPGIRSQLDGLAAVTGGDEDPVLTFRAEGVGSGDAGVAP